MAKLQRPSLGMITLSPIPPSLSTVRGALLDPCRMAGALRPPFPVEGGQENNGRGAQRSLALLSTQHAKEKRKRKVDLRGGGGGSGGKGGRSDHPPVARTSLRGVQTHNEKYLFNEQLRSQTMKSRGTLPERDSKGKARRIATDT